MQALLDAFDPAQTTSHPAFGDLATMAIWGAAAVVLAARFFRWQKRNA
jgi:hypothetical protein